MTRKHFKLIADTIRQTHMSVADRKALASNMADSLATTNPNFKRARFLEACGV